MTDGEDRLIERIRRRISSAEGALLHLGIGDDAAVLRPARGADWVVTVDQFLEDVHFLAAAYSPHAAGYKALVRATSDIVAMGAIPQVFFLSLTLPAERTGRWLDGMLVGMARAAKELGLRLAGGDTAQSPRSSAKIALSVTVLGTVQRGLALSRSGTRAGDAIFVSGRLGAAQLGLELILRGLYHERRWKRHLAAQYFPRIFPALGQRLAQDRLATSMMDLSDGLSTDLHRLCRASGVGARIHARELPCVALPHELNALGLDPLQLALHGGEDYGLLFTVAKRRARRIPKMLGGVRLTRIGEIVSGKGRGSGITLVGADGRSSPLAPQGWDHFGQSARITSKVGLKGLRSVSDSEPASAAKAALDLSS